MILLGYMERQPPPEPSSLPVWAVAAAVVLVAAAIVVAAVLVRRAR